MPCRRLVRGGTTATLAGPVDSLTLRERRARGWCWTRPVEWGSHRLLVEFLFSVGPRIQEAAAATWEDIDPQEKVIRIRKQIGRSTNEPQKTKGGEARTAVVLQEWWPVHEEIGADQESAISGT